ncbi:MAG: RecQ family ATP-dependent DNA helicase [Pseudomonadota bacterium]
MKDTAERYLQQALQNPSARFRDGQWESIEHVTQGRRVLVVQRTGWGKSMVYFVATKLLREQGAGPTLLVSPLLSLMRNQLQAAHRMGINAQRIDSTNTAEWGRITADFTANNLDIILISPERLNNKYFQEHFLQRFVGNLGLFVVDEAHCISDWGHDFRPDYRRISRVIQAMPKSSPVLATTATANDRVVQDIASQLGHDILVQRGSLVRESLQLQNIIMPNASTRLAWLAQTIPRLNGSGIVYTLTQQDAENVAAWLCINGIKAKPYHAALEVKTNGYIQRETLEHELLNNEIKVLVATVALGMGFDKADLCFVIHYQRPSSVVHYYQQVGRAGRAVDSALGILLCGSEDDRIAEYFAQTSFPPESQIIELLTMLHASESGLSISELEKQLNLSRKQLTKVLTFLSFETPSPIVCIDTIWQATATCVSYEMNASYIDSILAIRKNEQEQMQAYMQHQGCLMHFLQETLDDTTAKPCGRCAHCTPQNRVSEDYDSELAQQALHFIQNNHYPILPRKQWPAPNIFPRCTPNSTVIPKEFLVKEGRALALWDDGAWGTRVHYDKYTAEHFSQALVRACVVMIKEWAPKPAPQWVTCIPSFTHPELVPDFAERLARALKLPFRPSLAKVRHNEPQKVMQNSYQQVLNLKGVFSVNNVLTGPCLLIDDIVTSRWTFTIAGASLRAAGCEAVYPLALAANVVRVE